VLIVLSWVSNRSIGIDETRWEIDDTAAAPANNAVPIEVGQRVRALQLSIETFNTKPDSPNANAVAERIKNRIRLPASRTALANENVAMATVGDITQSDYRVDQRWISRVILEVTLNDTSFERGDVGDELGTIDAAIVSSTFIEGVDGDPIPDSEQLVDEVMP
jgi:hypothetical protein